MNDRKAYYSQKALRGPSNIPLKHQEIARILIANCQCNSNIEMIIKHKARNKAKGAAHNDCSCSLTVKNERRNILVLNRALKKDSHEPLGVSGKLLIFFKISPRVKTTFITE